MPAPPVPTDQALIVDRCANSIPHHVDLCPTRSTSENYHQPLHHEQQSLEPSHASGDTNPLAFDLLPLAGRAIVGVNKTIQYVPASGNLDRFGQAMNWFFVGILLLSGAVYFTNGIRYDTTSAGESLLARCSLCKFVHTTLWSESVR